MGSVANVWLLVPLTANQKYSRPVPFLPRTDRLTSQCNRGNHSRLRLNTNSITSLQLFTYARQATRLHGRFSIYNYCTRNPRRPAIGKHHLTYNTDIDCVTIKPTACSRLQTSDILEAYEYRQLGCISGPPSSGLDRNSRSDNIPCAALA